MQRTRYLGFADRRGVRARPVFRIETTWNPPNSQLSTEPGRQTTSAIDDCTCLPTPNHKLVSILKAMDASACVLCATTCTPRRVTGRGF